MPKSKPSWRVEEVYEAYGGTIVKLVQTTYEPSEESPKVGEILTVKPAEEE